MFFFGDFYYGFYSKSPLNHQLRNIFVEFFATTLSKSKGKVTYIPLKIGRDLIIFRGENVSFKEGQFLPLGWVSTVWGGGVEELTYPTLGKGTSSSCLGRG